MLTCFSFVRCTHQQVFEEVHSAGRQEKRSASVCASCGTCERLRQACLFVCLICMLVFSSAQTSNFHPILSFQPSSFLVLETSHPFVLIFSTCSTFDLLADASGFKIMEKMSYSLHCIYFMFFLRPRERVQAFQDEERGESSSVAVSRVEPCPSHRLLQSCPWKMARSSYTSSYHKLVLRG